MPSIEENRRYWSEGYAWPRGGDEWSRDWGSPAAQWHGTLLPRICAQLPAHRILEIGCGWGRWTAFLLDHCEELVAVDVGPTCIEACRTRFADQHRLTLHVNDGALLPMVADRSVDFAFSFDALPLVDAATIGSYLAELGRVLATEGAAFLHHSQLGAYRRFGAPRGAPVGRLRALLGLGERDYHWRDPGVDVALVARLARASGLSCIAQETLRWGTRRAMLDAFSLVVRQGSGRDRPPRLLANRNFMREVCNAARLHELYGE